MINRRTFALGVASACLLKAPGILAQTSGRIPRIGVLGTALTAATQAIPDGLRDLGWIEGQTVIIEWRWARGNPELHAQHAAEFVKMGVDLIYAPDSAQVEAALSVTRTIPIVFAIHADPLAVGHVASLARPGGNVTGVALLITEMATKGLELLDEILSGAKRVGVLWNPAFPSHLAPLDALDKAAATLGVELHRAEARGENDYDPAFASLAKAQVSGVVVVPSTLAVKEGEPLAKAALKHKLPTIFAFRQNAERGGLMSYGPDLRDALRRSTGYIDRILRGANPAELPIDQAVRFELTVNVQTARALGLSVPPAVLARADEVIE
jgi:putative tryptophan/tyrosine transport system substrate-binding protein